MKTAWTTRGLLMAVILAGVALHAARQISVAERIRTEALEHSAVMETALQLTDVSGPRLTGSESFNNAMAWAARRLRELGAVNVHTEPFDWGIRWSYSHMSLELVGPQPAPLLAYPITWSAGTPGRVTGDVFQTKADVGRFEESAFDEIFNEIRGRVRDKFVMVHAAIAVPVPPVNDAPVSRRFTDAELSAMEEPLPPPPAAGGPALSSRLPYLLLELMQRLKAEGARGVLWRGSGGAGLVSVSTIAVTYRDAATPAPLPIVYVAVEHYNRLARLMKEGGPVRVALDLDVQRSDAAVPGMNLIADFPGTTKPDEMVMLGAHLDSWPGATGATDNAAGCAIVIEAARILRALRLETDRTVRVALWGGEEGAGAGSRAYVKLHLRDGSGPPKPEAAKLFAYFNVDNGTGKIRGLYTDGYEGVGATFRSWLVPLAGMGARTVSPQRPTGIRSSDDGTFIDAGLPGFAFIQDPLDYSRTHHTNIDLYDRLQRDDLQQAAAVTASIAYAAATHAALLRK
jgi:hypothetical protein